VNAEQKGIEKKPKKPKNPKKVRVVCAEGAPEMVSQRQLTVI